MLLSVLLLEELIWSGTNTSPLYYHSEIHLENKKGTVRFLFILTFTKLFCSYVNVVRQYAARTSQLGYAFPLERIHWRNCTTEAIFYINDDIVLCIHSLIWCQKSDFWSSSTIKCTTEVIFQKDTSTQVLKTVCINGDTTHFIFY